MSEKPAPAGAAVTAQPKFPAGIPFIVGNEGAERFSYYGMRAILYVYLAALYVQFAPDVAPEAAAEAKSHATAVAHLFMAGVYAFPMIGAILADRYRGKYPVIFWVSLIYCAGHAVLAGAGRLAEWEMYSEAEMGMYIGLGLIAVGSGGIKPCVSANVGDQFTDANRSLVTKVFQIFYFIINFGSFFSTIITPFLYKEFGAEIAFGVPGIMMGLATLVFWLGRNKFVHVPPKPGGTLGLMDFIASSLLFAPIFAVIVAVFVVGGDFEPASAEGMSHAAFYWGYVKSYVGFIATESWYYFAIGAALFVVGLIVFAQRQQRKEDNGFLAVVFYSFKHRKDRKEGEGFFAPAAKHFGEEAAEGPPAVLRIMLVFSMVSVFWALFDQHASTWIEQATQMDRSISLPYYTGHYAIYATAGLAIFGGTWLMMWVSNRSVPKAVTIAVLGAAVLGLATMGIIDSVTGEVWAQELEPAQISALNPLMVMIIIPALNFLVYGPMERRGREIRPLQKMTVGMFMAAAAFSVAAIIQGRMEGIVEDGERFHVLWQVIQYLVMTTAEVLVSVTGLEFAYTQAPRSMKSTIMGFWLLCVTGGNILVAFLAPTQQILELSDFFWLFTGLMATAAVIFMILAYFYKGRSYLQTAAAE